MKKTPLLNIALSRVISGVPQIVDYLNFENLGANRINRILPA